MIFDIKTEGTIIANKILKLCVTVDPIINQTKSLIPRTTFHRSTKQRSEKAAIISMRIVIPISVLVSYFYRNV